jgi:hypothetical protein
MHIGYLVAAAVAVAAIIAAVWFCRRPDNTSKPAAEPIDDDHFIPDSRQELFGANKSTETPASEPEIMVSPLQGVLPGSSRVFDSAGDTNFTAELAPDSVAEMQRARKIQLPPAQSARSRFISTNTRVVTAQ